MVNQIAIIIPTYNEEGNIERLIKNIKHYVGNVLIIVVDDSSNNKISTIIKKNSRRQGSSEGTTNTGESSGHLEESAR